MTAKRDFFCWLRNNDASCTVDHSSTMASAEIVVEPASVGQALLVLSFVVVIASIGAHLSSLSSGYGPYPIEYIPTTRVDGFVRLFSLDGEHNVPALFSTFLLILAAFLFFIIASIKKTHRNPYAVHWAVLALGFVVMAIDENLSFHENLIGPIRALLGEDNHLGIFYYPWVIPAIAVVLVSAAAFLRFFLNIPSDTRLKFAMAATLYLTGAVGFEMIGGSFAEVHGVSNLTYVFLITAEESLEISGIVVLIWALLLYISNNHGQLTIKTARSTARPTPGA